MRLKSLIAVLAILPFCLTAVVAPAYATLLTYAEVATGKGSPGERESR